MLIKDKTFFFNPSVTLDVSYTDIQAFIHDKVFYAPHACSLGSLKKLHSSWPKELDSSYVAHYQFGKLLGCVIDSSGDVVAYHATLDHNNFSAIEENRTENFMKDMEQNPYAALRRYLRIQHTPVKGMSISLDKDVLAAWRVLAHATPAEEFLEKAQRFLPMVSAEVFSVDIASLVAHLNDPSKDIIHTTPLQFKSTTVEITLDELIEPKKSAESAENSNPAVAPIDDRPLKKRTRKTARN